MFCTGRNSAEIHWGKFINSLILFYLYFSSYYRTSATSHINESSTGRNYSIDTLASKVSNKKKTQSDNHHTNISVSDENQVVDKRAALEAKLKARFQQENKRLENENRLTGELSPEKQQELISQVEEIRGRNTRQANHTENLNTSQNDHEENTINHSNNKFDNSQYINNVFNVFIWVAPY